MTTTLANLTLLGLTFISSSSFLASKLCLNSVGPFTLMALRFFIAAVLMGALYRTRLKRINREVVMWGLLAGTFLCAGVTMVTTGLLFAQTNKTAFLANMSVVFVPIFMLLLYKIFPTKSTVFGVLVATLGVVLMTIDARLELQIGDILALLGAALFSFYVICLSRAPVGIDMMVLAFVKFCVVSILSLGLALSFEGYPQDLDTAGLLGIIYLGVFASALRFSIQAHAQRHTNATMTQLIFTAEPAIASVYGYIFLGELFSQQKLIGAIFIVIGMLISQVSAIHQFGKFLVRKALRRSARM